MVAPHENQGMPAVATIEPGVSVFAHGYRDPALAQIIQAPAPAQPEMSQAGVPTLIEGKGGVSVDHLGNPTAVAVTEEPHVAEEELPKTWKDGKSLAEQEAIVKSSTDLEFLTSVMENAEETARTKRLAKKCAEAIAAQKTNSNEA